MNKIILNILILSTIVFYSCTKTREEKSKLVSPGETKESPSSAGVKEGEIEFTVEYPGPRRIYKIEKEDLNNDGNKEIIVMSVLKDTSERYSDYYNFDMIEVFALDPAKEILCKDLI